MPGFYQHRFTTKSCHPRMVLAAAVLALSLPAGANEAQEYYDSHTHLTNYVQEGITARQYLEAVGDRVERTALFGIPLQMHWSDRVTGKVAPTYYLDSDTALLLLLIHRRLYRRAVSQSVTRAAGALRTDDHRFQSG